jgi:DNA-binding PadR family transcriptional regulator
MAAVFSHGRLRLYLLKLLAEGPKHGYELIRLLENRFHGLYAPSAGTIYPRLQRLEAEGLVTHAAAGGRKVYAITEAGRAELSQRAAEVAGLEREIHDSLADLTSLANEIEQQVSGSARDVKRELHEAARQARATPRGGRPWQEPRPSGAAGGPSAQRGAELEQAVGQLAAEVRRLAQRPGVAEDDLRAATAVVTGALTEVRRLLRE